MRSDLEDAIIAAVRGLEPGEYMTYGEVAEIAGYPGRARAVGMVLATTVERVPWWRVVGVGGRIVSPARVEQGQLLEAEGHRLTGNRITASEPPN